jgi:hypothetical protein
MRRLFGAFSRTKSPEDEENNAASEYVDRYSSTENRGSTNAPAKPLVSRSDPSVQIVKCAATNLCSSLSEAVQACLVASASTHAQFSKDSDEMSGFVKVIRLLESDKGAVEAAPPGSDEVLQSTSEASTAPPESSDITTLLNNIDCPYLVEFCLQTGLAAALMNALRLLRMAAMRHEVLSGKRAGTERHVDNDAVVSTTFQAGENACLLLRHLWAEPSTAKALERNLVKLLCFPISAMPMTALHLQTQISRVISALCDSSLTGAMVWFLHDMQALNLMVRHLKVKSSSFISPKSDVWSSPTQPHSVPLKTPHQRRKRT